MLLANARRNIPTVINRRPGDDTSHEGRIIRAEVLRESLLGQAEPSGGVELHGALITGVLDLTGITVPAGLHLAKCEMTDEIQLFDAEIPRLNLRSCSLRGLRADGLSVTKAFSAQDSDCEGTMYLRGATVGGQFNLVGATLRGGTESALIAEGLRVGGDLLLTEEFTAEGGGDGVVRLLGARISGSLTCIGAHIRSIGGPSLHAERLTVDGNVFLCDAELIGRVVLHGTTVQGQLTCGRAVLDGQSHPALNADGLRTEGDVILSGLRASGRGERATVCLRGSRIGGALVCGLDDEAVNQTRSWRGVTAASPDGASLDLMLAELGSTLTLWPGFTMEGRVLLDGLTYRAVPQGMDRREWTEFLRERVDYATQPYQQLSAAYRASGQDVDARALLIAQQDHRLRRPDVALPERVRLGLLRLTLGYGYQSWRALVGLGLTLACAMTLVLAAGRLSHSVKNPTTGRSCPTIDQIGLSVQLAVPLVNTTSRSRCDLIAADMADAWPVAGGWTFQIFGWAFATLFVAGYSGLIRKN